MEYTMKECGGCVTCEIACSYRHKKEFNHLISSIEIVEKGNAPGYFVRLTQDASGIRIPCDGCLDENDEPLCVRYCPKPTQLKAIIDQFVAERLKKEGKDE